jgi:hypothetical protein
VLAGSCAWAAIGGSSHNRVGEEPIVGVVAMMAPTASGSLGGAKKLWGGD